jgi:hypothetical protein
MELLKIELTAERMTAYDGHLTLRDDCHGGVFGFVRRTERVLLFVFGSGSHQCSCSSTRRGVRREWTMRWRSQSRIVCA